MSTSMSATLYKVLERPNKCYLFEKQGVKDIRYDMSTFPCDMDIVSMDMMDMDHLVDLLF